MPTTRLRSLLLTGPVVLSLLLAACSSPETPDHVEPEPSPTATEPAPAGDGPVQDTWIYERVRTVDADGTLVDVTRDMVAGLDVDPGAEVELVDGVTFTPLPALRPQIRDEAGNVREDLEVIAGIVETDRGRGIQVVATPSGSRSVDAGDLIVIDLSHLGLETGAPLVVDFAFGQGLPADGEQIDGKDGVELLRDRLAAERFQWYATDVDGETVPGLLTVFGSVPQVTGRSGATGGSAATGVGDGAFRVSTVAATHRVVPMAGGISGGGGIPTKADPVIDPVGDLAMCTDGPIDCLSQYFKSQKKGSQKSLDDLFNRNMGCTGDCGSPGPCTGSCGGKTGEPHIMTFDGVRYDLQLVGEFTLAQTDGLVVQTRTAPYGSSTIVSVVTATAIEVDGHRIIVRSAGDPVLEVDGTPLDLAQARTPVELGSSTAVVHGDSLYVRRPDGSGVEVHGMRGRYLDVYVDSGGSRTTWSGLLGSPDGTWENDLTTRDGVVLAPEHTVDELYGVFGESWRLTDQDSRFTYPRGESTATFTDRTFPTRHMTISDLTPAQRSTAETVCRLAGIEKEAQLAWCIFDYAITGDVSFVRTTQRVRSVLDPAAGEWLTRIRDVEDLAGDMVLDHAEHALVPLSLRDGGRVDALDLATGQAAWSVPTSIAGCVAATETRVIVPLAGEGGTVLLGLLDPADGHQVDAVPTGLKRCDRISAVGDVVMLLDRNHLLGVDALDGQVRFDLDLPGLAAGPVVSGDGAVWVVRNTDDAVTAERIDPATGTSTAVPVPVTWAHPHATATDDGLVLAYQGENRDVGGLLRLTTDGVVWRTPLPTSFAGTPVEKTVTSPIAVGDRWVAAYLHSQLVGVFDLATGNPERTISPTSFNNNKERLAIADGVVVVGPMGGKSWIETWRLADGQPAWTRGPADLGDVRDPSESGKPYHDMKHLGPRTPSGQLLVGTQIAGGGAVVGLVGPGR